jgi:hypothetical protein
MESLVGSYNLTKDKDKLIMLYDYRVKMNELEKSKKGDESRIMTEMLEKYQKDESLLYLPGMAEEDSAMLEQNSKSEYYDSFAKKSTETGVSAMNAAHDAEYYESEIQKLSEDDINLAKKNYAKQEVNRLMETISKKINNYIDLSEETVSEYYNTSVLDNSVKKISKIKTFNALFFNIKRTVAFGVILGLIIGLILITYNKRNRYQFRENMV